MIRLVAALSLLPLSCVLPTRAGAVPISMLTGSVTLQASLTLPLSAGLTVFPGGLLSLGGAEPGFPPVIPGTEIIGVEARGFETFSVGGRPPSVSLSLPARSPTPLPFPDAFFFASFSVANLFNTSDAPVFVDVTVRTIANLSLSAGAGGAGVLGGGAFLPSSSFGDLGGGAVGLVPCFSEHSLCPAQSVVSDHTATSRVSIHPGYSEIAAVLSGEFQVYLPLEPVPEPTTLALWGMTVAGLGYLARRKRKGMPP